MNGRTISRVVGALALLATAGLSLPLIAGFFPSWHPVLDLLAHFRVHLAALLILAAVPLMFFRRFRLNGVLAAALGAGAIVTVTGLSSIPLAGQLLAPVKASSEPDDSGAVYKLMQLNLRYNNPEPGKVLSLIGRLRPDAIVLNEVSSMWEEKVALLAGAYPYRVVCRTGRTALLSLRPFVEGAEGECLAGGIFVKAMIDFGGYPVEIAGLHLRRPWPNDQAGQIEDLTPLLGALGDTAILAGDMNATPWSAASARIAAASAMVAAGPDTPTWLSRKLPEWMRFAGFPIDRMFAKGDVSVHSVRTLEWVGSDHLPVLMEFSLKPASPEESDDQTSTAWLAE